MDKALLDIKILTNASAETFLQDFRHTLTPSHGTCRSRHVLPSTTHAMQENFAFMRNKLTAVSAKK